MNRIGTTISHYQILDKLGEGGMGVVYKAQDTRLKRLVALKFLPKGSITDDSGELRFVREAQASAALDHPNVCGIYDIGEVDGESFIAMTYVEGESLKDKIAAGPLEVEKALRLAIQAAEGLEAAHERGIIHRDIKSANLMISAQDQLKILDFGLAKLQDQSQITAVGMSLGTLAYMSPEQAMGTPVDGRTDVWGLGVVLYEMLAGKSPFERETVSETLGALVNSDPEPIAGLRPGVPLEVEPVIRRALAKKPVRRYRSMSDFLTDLRAVHGRVLDTASTEKTLMDTDLATTSQSLFKGQGVRTTASEEDQALRILVVDDEPDLELLIRQRFRKKIQSHELEFSFAEDGLSALELLESNGKIDIVLTDINMPRMDGLTLLSRLSQSESTLRTVVVSAYGDMENIRTAMNRGAFDFVTKPIDFGDLEKTIEKARVDLEKLREAEKAHDQLAAVRQELEVARRIQEAGTPRSFPSREEVDIYAFASPGQEVGGDFYDFFMMEDQRLGFALGDASSKGVSAATYVTVVRTLVKALALTGMGPAESLTFLNRLLYPESLRAMSVTLFYGVLDLTSGALEYSNAGHPPPYRLGLSGDPQFLPGPPGTAICSTPDSKYETGMTTLEQGDMLVLFTDGVLETGNEMGIPFSQQRLTAILGKRAEVSSAVSVIRDVVREMEEYSSAPQIDDSTLLAVRWQGHRS